jgi:hypothetical protein
MQGSFTVATMDSTLSLTERFLLLSTITLLPQQILSKGKVLYPNPLFTNSEISQQLMDQSPQDTGGASGSNSSSSNSKVALMVVGTVIGHELAPPPPTSKDGNDNGNSRPWWQMVIRTGQAIVWQVWNWSWIILHRALAATSQTLLAYTRQQPPAGRAGRPEEVE